MSYCTNSLTIYCPILKQWFFSWYQLLPNFTIKLYKIFKCNLYNWLFMNCVNHFFSKQIKGVLFSLKKNSLMNESAMNSTWRLMKRVGISYCYRYIIAAITPLKYKVTNSNLQPILYRPLLSSCSQVISILLMSTLKCCSLVYPC